MALENKQKNNANSLMASAYRTVFDMAQVGMVIIDCNGIICEANKAFCDFLGYENDELIEKRLIEYIDPIDIAKYEQTHASMSHGDARSQHIELKCLSQDAGAVYGKVTLEYISCNCSNSPCLLAQVQDITKTKTQIMPHWQDFFRFSNRGMVCASAGSNCMDDINPAYANMHGYTVEELRGRPIADVYPTEVYASVRQHIEKAHKTGHYTFESMHLRKDGTTFPVLVEANTVYNEHGEAAYRIVFVQDISERKETERVLRQYAALVESSDDAIIGVSVDGTVSNWNQGAETMFGYKAREIIGKSIDILSPPDRLAEELIILRRIGKSEHFKDYKTVRKHKNGNYIDISMTISPIYDAANSNIGAVLISRDIGSYKRMEEELLYRENKFRTLAENTPNIIARYDRDLNRVYVNPAFVREIGISKKDALKNISAAPWKGINITASEYKEILHQVLDTGKPVDLILEWKKENISGYEIYAFQIVTEQASDGRKVGLLAIGHNITALKQAEKELAESHDQLRELAARRETAREEERRHIAREMHDEFGQLLTAIRIETSLIRQQYQPDDVQFQEKVQRVVSLVDKTILQVRNMATMLRPAALGEGIDAALEWLADEFTARTGTPCKLQVTTNVCNMDEPHSVAVFRIVQEALTNIARHAEAGRVSIMLQRERDSYQLKVIDDGKGFNTNLRKGRSLGLVGVRERVLMLDGEMKIISAPNEGTVLDIYLPERIVASESDFDMELDRR